MGLLVGPKSRERGTERRELEIGWVAGYQNEISCGNCRGDRVVVPPSCIEQRELCSGLPKLCQAIFDIDRHADFCKRLRGEPSLLSHPRPPADRSLRV